MADEAPTETTAPDEAPATLDALLASLPDPDATDAAPAEAPADTDAPAEAPVADPFSDAALATPAGIKAAQAAVRAERARWLDAKTKADRRNEKLTQQRAAFAQEKQALAAQLDQFRADISILRKGDPRAKLDMLGRMFGKPGTDAYEELSLAFLGKGKATALPPEVSAELQELRAEIKALRSDRETEKQTAQQAANQQYVAAESRKIVELASDESAYPFVAAEALESPAAATRIADEVVAMVVAHYKQTGEDLPYGKILAKKEELLRARYSRAAGGPKGKADPATATKTAKTAPSSPLVTPSRASGSSVRSVDDDELMSSAADPAYLRSIGLGDFGL